MLSACITLPLLVLNAATRKPFENEGVQLRISHELRGPIVPYDFAGWRDIGILDAFGPTSHPLPLSDIAGPETPCILD